MAADADNVVNCSLLAFLSVIHGPDRQEHLSTPRQILSLPTKYEATFSIEFP